MNIFTLVFSSIWFFLPIAFANGSAVVAAKVPALKRLNQPMDFGMSFRGRRILGSHKTIRGFIVGSIVGVVIVYLQVLAFREISFINEIALIDYDSNNIWILGLLFGLGAIIGDSVKSFFKRQLDRKPGSPWFPFDQIDSILGGMIFSLAYVQLDFKYYLVAFLVWLLLTPATNIIAYTLGLRDTRV